MTKIVKVTELRVVCGAARSGTTFVREIVRHASRCPVVEEPLNVKWGVVGVPVAYPYVADSSGEYASLIDDVVAFARPWTRNVNHRNRKLRKRAVYRLTGGQWGARWGLLRLAKRFGLSPKCLLWKDPFVTLATPYLLSHYGARVVCMLRHPGGVNVSMRNQGWGFDIRYLRRQPELMRAVGYDILSEHWERAESSTAASIAILWKLMLRVALETAANDKRFLLIKHEDLCVEPMKVAAAIVAHFGLELSPAARRFIAGHSQGNRTDAEHARDLRRDSRALMDAWRGRITAEDEAIMQEVIGQDFFRVYPRW
jgi:Sulfotransferase family